MKRPHATCHMPYAAIRCGVTAIVTLALLLVAVPVVLTAEPDNTIHIQADQLEADIEGDTAEFSGNVQVDRGEARISADHLKLYYHREQNVESLQQLDVSAVDKIEARGKVRIRFQDLSAATDKAVYEPKTDTLVLEGSSTRVTKGGNSIRGSRIVLKAAENDMTVVGDGKSRVKAVIATGKGFF